MSTHTLHGQKNAIYFITFSCYKWLHLIDKAGCYYAFDKWFEYLDSQLVSLLAFVIMPNHFHGLVFIPENCEKNLNQLVSNGKRFLAYEIVKGLKEKRQTALLDQIQSSVSLNEKVKGKKHNVFISSFDAKECFNLNMVEIKLDYIHFNPVIGKWNLAKDYVSYPHSSAAFYELGKSHKYVRHYREFI